AVNVNEWLKEGKVELTVKRVLMHGLPGSGKTCSQRLLLNKGPPEKPVTDSTGIACRAVKATRMSAHDDRMEEIDVKALLLRLAHDLKKAAAKQKKSPTEDHSTEPMEDSSETKTTEPAKLADESGEATKTGYPADDIEANKIISDIVKEIPNAKGKFDRHWVYFIDSGGQTAFQELLPLFIRASSFNIITLDLSKDIDIKLEQKYRINGESLSQIDKNSTGDSKPFSCTNIQFLKDTLSSGAILQPYQPSQPIGSKEKTSTGSSSTDPQCPEYFVLGTHEDQKKPGVIEKYNDELQKLKLGSEKKGYRIIPAVINSPKIIYPVNTMLESGPKREEEAEKLCKIIYNQVSGDEITIPVQWFAFELTLLEKAEREGRSFLPIEDVLHAGESLKMNKAQTEKALQHLHDVTIILYYPQVSDYVFVDPHPILDILSRLLVRATYEIPQEHLGHFVKKTSLSNELEEDLKFRGLFTKALLKKLKDDEDFSKPNFIKLLLHLHIIVEIDKKDESEEKKYFIPSALPPCPKTRSAPKSDIDPLQIVWCSRESDLEDSYEILPVPRGIFFLAIVNLMKHSKPLQFRFASKSPEYFRYRDAMSFRVRHQKDSIGIVHIIKKDRCIEIYFEA
uniref:Uncharacterized protein n=1 Tax=Amphimedon queenslandica TaxID=400682 RepID=A0A1X7SSY6_AMPQE